MHPSAYSSTIDNSQIMERAQMSTDWWIGKEDIYIHTHTVCTIYMYIYVYIYIYVHTHNGILFSDQKELNLAICNNMDGPRVYYAKRNQLEKDKYKTSLIFRI